MMQMQAGEELKTGDGNKNDQQPRTIGIAVVVAIIAVGVAFFFLTRTDIGDRLGVGGRDTVATVNGQTITRSELDRRIEPLRGQEALMGAGGLDVPDEDELAQMVLEQMIMEEILMQEAERLGIEVDEMLVTEEMDSMRNLIGEDFDAGLAEIGFTSDDFEQMVRSFLTLQALADEIVPEDAVEVSDEEIRERYELFYADEGSLDELRSVIEEEIREEKRNILLEEYIEELRAQAAIDIQL